jgi:hypothetical protein
MPRPLQTSGIVLAEANSASASRSLRMIGSGEWRIRFMTSPPARKGKNNSDTTWFMFGEQAGDGEVNGGNSVTPGREMRGTNGRAQTLPQAAASTRPSAR